MNGWGFVRVGGEDLPLTAFGFWVVNLLKAAGVVLFVWVWAVLVWLCM